MGILGRMTPTRQSPATRQRDYRWADYDDEALLELRFSSLGLRFRSSPLWFDVERLHNEFERRGLRFKPHVWLSTDWFTPDGIPGFAVPFYLAHPRLQKLERKMMGEVEGGNRKWRHRIMRHEAGHAIDNAYGLRRRAGWRRVFGRASAPYPDTYSPRPSSRSAWMRLRSMWRAGSKRRGSRRSNRARASEITRSSRAVSAMSARPSSARQWPASRTASSHASSRTTPS